ncbi:MAG TPA: M3 family metallopeptidase [Gammaproteobacteria bacterium]|nr:M3 family metallopeptidase [Gammaproteobacteria bacterium]
MSNPLLETGERPSFSRIRPEHAVPAIERILAGARERIAILRELPGTPEWDTLIEPLEEIHDRIDRAWAPVSHLNAVCNTPAWREAYNRCLDLLTAFQTEIGQDEKLYRAHRRLRAGPGWDALEPARKQLVEHALRDFRLSGVALSGQNKQRFRDIAAELARASARFEEDVLDASDAWQKPVDDARALRGLPDSAMALLARAARREGREDYLVTLEFPAYLAVMTHAEDPALRHEVYQAFGTRASDRGPHAGRWDNGPVMEEILRLRHESARLLGYDNYAELSLVPKMAPDVETVVRFLEDLAARARPVAGRELAELTAFARERDGRERLEPWDIAFYSERLRRERFRVSLEELRPYFPVDRVLGGMFEVVRRLYGLEVRRVDGVADTWHDDVEYFEICEPDGGLRGAFYTDLYARPHKRGGAWMGDCVGRRRTARGVQTPVAFLTCNFTPPVGDGPALLTHDEVVTLFHEFGHSLHHLLTRMDYLGVSGLNGVPWDAVELPSQFMENFCWEREALDLISGHVETGEPLPPELFERLHAARNFQAGMQMCRQLEFSLFDMRLHRDYDPARGGRIRQTLDAVREQVAVVIPPPWHRFPNSFDHIFAGAYAAGYYSYKWAELLSADAFSAFEEAGVFDRATGLRFLHEILEPGGSRNAGALFRAFRGRDPSIEPLLRHNGIAA